MYTLRKNPISQEIDRVYTFNGNIKTSIPFDPANTDYQEYLKWLSEGNTPEPADSVPNPD